MAEVALEAPQGGALGVGLAGFKVPADRVDESHGKLGSQTNSVLEPSVVPDLGGSPSLWREGRLYQGLPLRPRRQIVCWKRFEALP